MSNNSLINFQHNGQRQGLKVSPKDSVEDSQIYENAIENLALISKQYWIQKCKLNNETAWMFSAGPELERLLKLGFINHGTFSPGSGNVLFCIKHSLPTLTKYGYTPHFCIALDPRPVDGISTHGKLRSSLYGSAPKETKFLIASMTHPSVTKFLLNKGYQVFGWHSAAKALVDKQGSKIADIRHFITGGTCSATRCIGMAHFLGFRKINLIGMDSNLSEEPKDPDEIDPATNNKKYWKVGIGKPGGKEFWTTGELIAQIQDLEMFLSNELSDIEVNILGADKESSLAGALNETIVNKTKTQSTYQQQVGSW